MESLETQVTPSTGRSQVEASHLLAEAGELAERASLLLQRSLRGIPLRHHLRLERIAGVQRVLAHTFGRLSVAFSDNNPRGAL